MLNGILGQHAIAEDGGQFGLCYIEQNLLGKGRPLIGEMDLVADQGDCVPVAVFP